MINRIRTLNKDVFFRSYAVYFTGSMIVAVLNYVFYPVLGRLLSPSDFGDLQALISLITQFSLILGAFSVIAVNITANTENPLERDAIIAELQKITFWIIGIVFVFLLLSITKLKLFFNFSSIYPLIGLVILLPTSAFAVFRNAYLQGSGRFKELSLAGIISSLGRLVFAIVFILLGLRVFGATLGIIISNIFVLIYLFYQTKNSLRLGLNTNMHTLEKGSVIKELKYGVLVFFATGLVTLFYTSDILIVKHYFNSVEAGLYSGISAIAKILFFAVGPVATVLFSSLKIKQTFKENLSAFKKSLLITFIVGGVGIFMFSVFNDMIVSLMIGSKYASFAHFLPKAGLMMLLTAIVNIFIFYFLALRRFFLIVVSLAGASFLWFILLQGHADINTILNNLILSLIIIIISLTTAYAKDYFHHNTRS
ncbi:MAG: oligosaccharide flippase family protein [bacterium]|nr:oligosaccharide flippase family protein [bacterium]